MAKEEIKTGEYSNFDSAQGTVETLNKNISDHQKNISDNKTKLSDESIFAGPISDACQEQLTGIDGLINSISANFTSIKDYVGSAVSNYQQSDQDAVKYLSIKDGKVVVTSAPAGNQALASSLTGEIGKRSGDYGDSPVGFHAGEWCADFVSYMLKKNGFNYRWSSLAGANGSSTIFGVMQENGAQIHYDKFAARQGKTPDSYTPQPGDVCLLNVDSDSEIDHVGFVLKDNGDGTVTTIEGNTSKNGQSYDGRGIVEQKVRSKDNIYGYATPTMKTT